VEASDHVKAPRAVWIISFENVDVTDELGPMATSVEYTDNVQGTSDELAISCEDRMERWRTGWFPSENDRITVKLGWEDEPLLDAGAFKVDEVELGGVPDTVSIRALAAQSKQPVRTVQYRGFEDTDLRAVMRQLAQELGLAFEGDVAALPIKRVTQQETTLAFMRKIGERYGYAFSLRADRISFYSLAALERAPTILTFDRTDLIPGYKFKSKAANTYAACELSYFDPKAKKTRVVRVEEKNTRQRITIGGNLLGGGGSSAPSIPTRVLKDGITGADVQSWQLFLRSKGIEPGPIDGIFGPKTRAATMNFQKGAGIGVDGVVGPETMRAAVAAGFGSESLDATRSETSGNVLRITRRAESDDDAAHQARAALAAANRLKVSGSFDVVGNTKLVAGITIELTGLGRLSGRFKVTKSKHKVDRSGAYVTSVELESAPAASGSSAAATKKAEEEQRPSKGYTIV
jgi:phage protein D